MVILSHEIHRDKAKSHQKPMGDNASNLAGAQK